MIYGPFFTLGPYEPGVQETVGKYTVDKFVQWLYPELAGVKL
jgi:hypothetical protein